MGSDVKITLAFDVYGTLVDPSAMAVHLAADVGVRAEEFTEFWREKQLEYAFRRGLMRNYVAFSVCTAEALRYTCARFRVDLSEARQSELLYLYQKLPPFSDALPALTSLQSVGRLFAFSNGTASHADAVLKNSKLRDYFVGIVSADAVQDFKPSPAVYLHARRVAGAWSAPFCVVSSNPWDVIGARSAGLDAVWVRRSAEKIYDPWGIEPSVTVSSLTELAAGLTK